MLQPKLCVRTLVCSKIPLVTYVVWLLLENIDGDWFQLRGSLMIVRKYATIVERWTCRPANYRMACPNRVRTERPGDRYPVAVSTGTRMSRHCSAPLVCTFTVKCSCFVSYPCYNSRHSRAEFLYERPNGVGSFTCSSSWWAARDHKKRLASKRPGLHRQVCGGTRPI